MNKVLNKDIKSPEILNLLDGRPYLATLTFQLSTSKGLIILFQIF
jgi:hypothetical protein